MLCPTRMSRPTALAFLPNNAVSAFSSITTTRRRSRRSMSLRKRPRRIWMFSNSVYEENTPMSDTVACLWPTLAVSVFSSWADDESTTSSCCFSSAFRSSSLSCIERPSLRPFHGFDVIPGQMLMASRFSPWLFCSIVWIMPLPAPSSTMSRKIPLATAMPVAVTRILLRIMASQTSRMVFISSVVSGRIEVIGVSVGVWLYYFITPSIEKGARDSSVTSSMSPIWPSLICTILSA